MGNTAGAFRWELDTKPRQEPVRKASENNSFQQEFLVFSKQGNDMSRSHFQNSFSQLHGQPKMSPELIFFSKSKTSLEYFKDLKMVPSLYLTFLHWALRRTETSFCQLLCSHHPSRAKSPHMCRPCCPPVSPTHPGVVSFSFSNLLTHSSLSLGSSPSLPGRGSLCLCWDIFNACCACWLMWLHREKED